MKETYGFNPFVVEDGKIRWLYGDEDLLEDIGSEVSVCYPDNETICDLLNGWLDENIELRERIAELEEQLKNARKETAKKVIDRVEELSVFDFEAYEEMDFRRYIISEMALDNILKEYGEKQMKVYVVKAPYGEYESYQEPIDKIFLDEQKAIQYVEEENAKLPLDQAKKCEECYFKWENAGQRGKTRPSCYNGDKYNMCQEYNKYRDVSKLFIEEHKIEDIADYTKQVRKEVCEEIRERLNQIINSIKHNPSFYDNEYRKSLELKALYKNIFKILDQIQGETK